jgi:cell division septation protein DedD
LYSKKTNFEKVWNTLNDKGFQIAKSYIDRHNAHRVSIGPFIDQEEAQIALSVAKIMGFNDAYIYK